LAWYQDHSTVHLPLEGSNRFQTPESRQWYVLSLAGTMQLAFQPKTRETHWGDGGAAFMPLQRESLFGVRWRPDVLDSEAA
jgi:hypothetical protein